MSPNPANIISTIKWNKSSGNCCISKSCNTWKNMFITLSLKQYTELKKIVDHWEFLGVEFQNLPCFKLSKPGILFNGQGGTMSSPCPTTNPPKHYPPWCKWNKNLGTNTTCDDVPPIYELCSPGNNLMNCCPHGLTKGCCVNPPCFSCNKITYKKLSKCGF